MMSQRPAPGFTVSEPSMGGKWLMASQASAEPRLLAERQRVLSAAAPTGKGGRGGTPSSSWRVRCGFAGGLFGAGWLFASLDFFVWFLLASFLFVSVLPPTPFAGGAAAAGRAGATGAGATSTASSALALASARGQEKSSARPGGAAIASPRMSTRVAMGSDLPLSRMARSAQKIAALAAATHIQWHDRADGRVCADGVSVRWRLLLRTGQRNRHDVARQHPAQVVLDIMAKLQRAGLGEINAIDGAQPANLSFEIRPLHRVAAIFVNEAIPDIDIGDAGLLGARAIKLIEVAHVGGRARAANRRQSDPQHRHALDL